MPDAASPSPARPVVRLVAIRDEPLDPAEVIAAVADDRAGAVDVFIGTVRDHDPDERPADERPTDAGTSRAVDALAYSAHPTALDRLTEVADGVAADFAAHGVAVVHRTGPLAIGDLAVVCAVSTSHRAEAFEATRALIDRLKASVPIWKHQTYADGSDSWVGTP